MILFGYTDNYGILLVDESLGMSPGALPWGWGGVGRVCFSSWYVVSIDTGHIAQCPQSGPR